MTLGGVSNNNNLRPDNLEEKDSMKTKLTLVAFILIISVSFLIPESDYLTVAGVRTIALILAFILILLTNPIPLSVSCWVILALVPLIGVSPNFAVALAGFANPVIFFILASFCISAVFTTLPLSRRILIGLLRRYGRNMRSFLFAFMLCILPITAFLSSVPVAATFLAVALSFLEMFTDENERKNTGRAFMIAIPVTALLGGVATPVGSTMNLLAINLLEQHTGQTISFVQWMSIGIPIVLLVFPIAWLLIYRVYKPAEINSAMVDAFIVKLDVPKKISAAEKKVMIIFSCMIVLWILSSWVKQIDITVVALIGACCMFLPGINVLNWNQFIQKVNFDAIFLVGTVLCLGIALGRNGVSDWIAMSFSSLQMSLPVLIAFTVTTVFLILIVMPVGPSVVIFLAAPLITLAQTLDVNPELIIIALAMSAGNCYLLPLDTIPLITYSTGYYSMTDMPKSTLPLQIYVVVIITTVLSFYSIVLQII